MGTACCGITRPQCLFFGTLCVYMCWCTQHPGFLHHQCWWRAQMCTNMARRLCVPPRAKVHAAIFDKVLLDYGKDSKGDFRWSNWPVWCDPEAPGRFPPAAVKVNLHCARRTAADRASATTECYSSELSVADNAKRNQISRCIHDISASGAEIWASCIS